MTEIKHKNVIDVIPILPCLNSSRILGWRICGEERTQKYLSSPATIGPLGQDPGLTWCILIKKIANNTKINHKMISFSDHHNTLFIDRFSSKTKIGKDLWHFNSSLLEKNDFCSTTANLLSILKTTKNNYSSASDWWEHNKCKIKGNARIFSKNSTEKENISISGLKKRLRNLYKKENYKPEIKPTINTFELYLLESKQAKGTKIRANIRWGLEGEKCSKTFFKVLERQNMQNQTISELYTDVEKSKFSSNPNDILKSAKNFYENLYTRENVSKSAIDELLNQTPTN